MASNSRYSMLAREFDAFTISSHVEHMHEDHLPVLQRFDDYADLSRPDSLSSSRCSSRRGSDFSVDDTPSTPISVYHELNFPTAPPPTPFPGSPKDGIAQERLCERAAHITHVPCPLELEERVAGIELGAEPLSEAEACVLPEGIICRFCSIEGVCIPPAMDGNALLLPPSPPPSIRSSHSAKRKMMKKIALAPKPKIEKRIEKAIRRAFT